MGKCMTAAACALCAALLGGCAAAMAEEADAPAAGVEFRDVSDYFAPRDPEGAARILAESAESEEAANAHQEQQEAAGAAETAEVEYEPVYDGEAARGGSHGFHGDPDGLNSFDGVNYHEGRTETFYSGDGAAYRGGLWVDGDGFYRTEGGNYAVAVSEFEVNPATGEPFKAGDTFEGSQGTCEVVDSGCDEGVTDYCVSGWY